jgi:hypothetical protein
MMIALVIKASVKKLRQFSVVAFRQSRGMSLLKRRDYFATALKTFLSKSLPACNGLARIVRSCSPTTL